jgi:hypothetical protein
MSRDTAERWVAISAVAVLVVYAYQRIAGKQPTTTGAKAVATSQAPFGQFITAWGFTFLVIAGMAEAAPGLGGGFAILVMTADLLANTPGLVGSVKKQETTTTASSITSAGQQLGVAAGAASTPPARAGAAAVGSGVDTGVGSIAGQVFNG